MFILRHVFTFLAGIFVLITTTSLRADENGFDSAPTSDVGRPSNSKTIAGEWHFVKTRNPQGGANAISIMHTADTSKSDLDLVGVTLRCSEKIGAEVLIVVLQPLSLRAKPRVTLGGPENETRLEASVAPPGTAILLPEDAKSLVDGPWRSLNELPIRIEDSPLSIRGTVRLTGLQPAFKYLMTQCSARAP